LSDPYYTALPFIEHLIFEYLPHKETKEERFSSISMNKEKEENSVIDKLLGRLPIWPSASSPSLSTLPSNDAGIELMNLLQEQPKKSLVELVHVEPIRSSVSIVDRLNEAIRQATCNDNHNSTNNANHRIAVQA